MGAMSNSLPAFSELYYLDSVSEFVEDDELLTSVTCTDADGEGLTVNVTPGLPFDTRVVSSDVFRNQFGIVVVGDADLSGASAGISFVVVCSDGVASDTATVLLNVVPLSYDSPEFLEAPNPVHILSSVQAGTAIATYKASVSLHSSEGGVHECVWL